MNPFPYLAHAGKPIVVMCGGPSLPEAVSKITHDAIWLSANEHGAMLRPVDYLVAVDEHHQRETERQGRKVQIADVIRQHTDAPILSRRFGYDARIPDVDAMEGNCGTYAIYAAWLLGGHPIIVAGMDCYTGGTYFHDASAASSSLNRPLTDTLRKFVKLLHRMKGAQVRTIGGPLATIVPEYETDEDFGAYSLGPVQNAAAPVTPYRWLVDNPKAIVGRTRFYPGDICELTANEARLFKRAGWVEPA